MTSVQFFLYEQKVGLQASDLRYQRLGHEAINWLPMESFIIKILLLRNNGKDKLFDIPCIVSEGVPDRSATKLALS